MTCVIKRVVHLQAMEDSDWWLCVACNRAYMHSLHANRECRWILGFASPYIDRPDLMLRYAVQNKLSPGAAPLHLHYVVWTPLFPHSLSDPEGRWGLPGAHRL